MQNRYYFRSLSLFVLSIVLPISGWTTVNVVVSSLADDGSSGTLRAAINTLNSSGGGAITFSVSGTINLNSFLPAITQTCSITGPTGGSNGIAIDGAVTKSAIFFISSGTTTLSNLKLTGTAVGFAGSSSPGAGGGGGAGMGGAVLVDSGGSLITSNVNFTGNTATGGAGGASTGNAVGRNGNGSGGGGGGGASRGNGGAGGGEYDDGSNYFSLTGGGGGGGGGFSPNTSTPGGGGIGSGGTGFPNSGGAGGVGGGTSGGAAGANGTVSSGYTGSPGSPGGPGTAFGGGGGGAGGGATSQCSGSGPVCNNTLGNGANGGAGNDYSGGGGGSGSGGKDGNNKVPGVPYSGNGGAGGFGGGGGGAGGAFNVASDLSTIASPTVGGGGGFGGGGGGSLGINDPIFGHWCVGGGGGYSAGAGEGGANSSGGGGGGAGLGGAIFVRSGGNVTIGADSFSLNTVSGGAAGSTGAAAGSGGGADIFVQSGGNLVFNIPTGQTLTLDNAIESDNTTPITTTFVVNGGGTLLLTSPSNAIYTNPYVDIEGDSTLAFGSSGSLLNNSYNFGTVNATLDQSHSTAGFSANNLTSSSGYGIIKLGPGQFNFGQGTSNYGGAFVGSGAVSAAGSSLTLNGASPAFSGTFTIGSSALTLGQHFNYGASSTLDITSNATIITADTNSGSIYTANNFSFVTNTLTMNGANPLTITGGISATGPFTITGIGVSGSEFIYSPTQTTNFHQQAINVNTATLTIGISGALDSAGTLNMGNGTTLKSTGIPSLTIPNAIATKTALTIAGDTGTLLTLTGLISGTAQITKTSSNTLYLAPVSGVQNTFSGGISVIAGTLKYGTDNAVGGGLITLNNATLQASSSFNTNKLTSVVSSSTIDVQSYNFGISSSFSGSSGTLDVVSTGGGGVLTLLSTNTYLGTIRVNSGATLNIFNGSCISGGLTLNGGTLQAAANFSASNNTTVSAPSYIDFQNHSFLLSGNITANGNAITVIGASPGMLVLSGTNILGNLVIGANAIVQGTNSAFIASAGSTITINGLGTLWSDNNSLTLYQGIVINSAGNIATFNMNDQDAIFNGALSSTGSMIFDVVNATILTLTQPSTASGQLNFSGASNPTLTLMGVTPLGTATINASSSMTLDLSQGGASGSLPNPITIPSSIGVTVSTGTNSPTLSGLISSAGSLTKTGSGTLTLTGANNYSGGTTLSAGAIVAGNNSALGPGLINMASGTTLEAGGAFTLSNLIQLNGSNYFNSNFSFFGLSGTISGSGSATLIKDGPGSLILSGTNSGSSWNTHVTDGVLALNSFNPLGTGTLTLDNGTTLQTTINGSIVLTNPITATTFVTINVPSNNALTLSGIVSGNADIQKTANGTLTLSGINTFTGGMTIFGGTVVVTNSASLGTTGVILMENNTTLQATSSLALPNDFILFDTVSFDPTAVTLGVSGTLLGSGTLNKPSPGTLSLTGDNSAYSGSIQVLQGTLSGGVNNSAFGTGKITLSGGTTLQASSSITIANNISLIFPGGIGVALDPGASNTFEIDGTISGAGPVHKISAGTVRLSGAGTYTGGTVINGGTLAIVHGNALPSTGNVVINSAGTLDLSTTTQAVTVGDFSGTGPLKAGGATQPFTFGGGIVGFNYINYSGTITGTRPMIKNGPQNYSFSLNSPAYTGTFSINQAIVYINGTFGGNVVVNSGGILRGNSTLGSLVNNGRVSPGNSIGTITTIGNYTQNSNGILVLEIDAKGENDMIISGQNAELGGTINISPLKGTYLPTTYHLIHANGAVTGFWNHTNFQSNPLVVSLDYQAQDVYLFVLKPRVIFGEVIGYNPNIMKTYLEAYDTDEIGLFNYLLNLDASPPLVVSAALDLMHPALFGGLGLNKLNISTSLAQFFTRGNPGYCCSDVCLCEDASFWVIPFGQNFHVAGVDQQKGFHSTNLGVLGGIDGCVTDYVSLGVSCGFTHSKIKWEMSAGDGTINSYFGALYGDFKINEGYVNVSARAASNSFDCNRHIYFPSYITPGSSSQFVDFVANNTHSGVDLGAHLEGGYTVHLNHDQFRITPHAEADYFYMQEGGYSEKNASYFNLDVERRDTSYTKASIGLRLSRPIKLEKGCITPLVDLGWANIMPMQGDFFHANMQGIPYPFMVRTFTDYWNLFLVSAELSGTITDYTEVSAGYSLETDGHYTSQQLDVRFGFRF